MFKSSGSPRAAWATTERMCVHVCVYEYYSQRRFDVSAARSSDLVLCDSIRAPFRGGLERQWSFHQAYERPLWGPREHRDSKFMREDPRLPIKIARLGLLIAA